VSLLHYRLNGDVMTIVHTEVPPALAGHGIGAELMRAAFELARTENWRAVPACSYAAAMLRMIGVEELVVADEDDYVATVTELCADPARRERLRSTILAGNEGLFNSGDVVPALEEFLLRACGFAAG
jgi:predicted GNAT family acetyltransferase